MTVHAVELPVGPAWVTALRRTAQQAASDLPFPEPREELWRFTDTSLLKLEQYEPVQPPAQPQGRTLEGEASGRMVHADGALASIELSDEARTKGVIWTDLESAQDAHADLLEPVLGRLVEPDDVFRATSLALHRGGTFLYVPPGVVLDKPFQAMHELSTAGASLWPRTVVLIDRGAQVVFNDLYVSDKLDRPSLAAPVTEVLVKQDAKFGWVTWQDWGPGVRNLAYAKSRLEQNASINTLVVTLGGDWSRTWEECELAGEGAESIMLGLYFARGEQRFEHWTLQDHAVGKTRSDLLYKGAIADSAQTLYYGTIRIRPNARYSDAYQANRNLALSPQAKALTNPQLRIENSLVRCTHGATVGRVDEEQLFYLMSRGIPRAEAERLIVSGFFNDVLARATWSGMHERLGEAIEARLR